ncbi:hypothetical protein [Streptomyces drozdowiczii]
MIRVTTEWHQQRTTRGKTRQHLLEGKTEEFEWPDSVASSVVALLEALPNLTFSGMEDFGEGECVLTEGHNCANTRHRKDCRAHHINSVREWVEERVDEMKPGESVDFTGGGLKWVSVQVEVLPDPEPEVEEEDPPEEEQPAEVPPAPAPAEAETYTKHMAFSSEVRLIGQPVTHAEDTAATLAEHGSLVRARPYYAVPDRPGGLTRARSPFTFEGHIVGTSGADMVVVKWTWETDSAPWRPTGAFKPEELHNVWTCDCAACHGRIGIQEMDGA